MGDWVDVASADLLHELKPTRIAIAETWALLVSINDQVLAIGNQCTHQGAGLDRGVLKIAGSVRTVTCPAHGSMFDLETGKVMRPPATKPALVYDVKVEDGRILLRGRE